MRTIINFILLALLINVGGVTGFYILDDVGMLEWEVMYAVPLGIVNGIILAIYQIKTIKNQREQKELDKLR